MSRWIASEAPRRSWSGAWVAAALPWGLLVVLVATCGLDLPLIDQWSFIPQIERFYTGTLSLPDLWAQHGEHRLIFPRVIMLALAKATGWNILYELALNLLLATLLFLVLVSTFQRASAARWTPPGWIWVLLSLAVFSLTQWENWLWGWQIQVFLNALCVALGILVLTRNVVGWKELALAGILGIVATYSFGNGLLFWPIGLAILVLARTSAPKRLLVGSWLVLSAAVIWSYLFDFQSGHGSAAVETLATHPLGYLRFVATYLGSPLASFSGSAWPPRDTGIAAIVGAAGVLLLLAATRRAIRRGRDAALRLAPFLALAAYALVSGLVVAVARFRYGTPGAMASRYTTVSTLFWIGTIGVVLGEGARKSAGASTRTPAGAWRWSLLAIGALIAASSLYSVRIFPARRTLLLPARAEMTRGEDVALLARLHPEIQQVRYGLPILRHFHLSVFRDVSTTRELAESRPKRLSHFGQILRPLFRIEAVRPGQEVKIPVRITNPTSEVWSASGDGTGTLAVHLSYHWLDFAGRVVVYDGSRTSLPRDLRPGETVAVEARVASPATPGQYRLDFSMVQEGVSWFDAAAGGAAQLPVEVVP